MRRGFFKDFVKLPFPFIPSMDFAGTVAELGEASRNSPWGIDYSVPRKTTNGYVEIDLEMKHNILGLSTCSGTPRIVTKAKYW